MATMVTVMKVEPGFPCQHLKLIDDKVEPWHSKWGDRLMDIGLYARSSVERRSYILHGGYKYTGVGRPVSYQIPATTF